VRVNTGVRSQSEVLPDFCGSRRVIAVLVIAEAAALIIALAGWQGPAPIWERVFLISLYLQWIGIFSAAVLCLIRRHGTRLTGRWLAVTCYAALLFVTWAISEITYMGGRFTGIAPVVSTISHQDFLVRNLGISAVVSALALRYFWLRAAWRQQAAAEAEARYQALQARIQPHFLFNSLNSIAALAAVRPDDTERAVEDLATLLRANLGEADRRFHRFEQELELSRAGVRVEQLRLGERLRVVWDVGRVPADWPVPPLSLQPLVENAIGHGVAQLPQGGEVTISGDVHDERLELIVTNPVPHGGDPTHGLREGLDNIRQRLALRYGERAALVAHEAHGVFNARLRLPRASEETSA